MPASSSRDRVLKRLQGFSNLLDRALPIPGTPYRFGLDPILGLIPGGGDFLGAAFSAYIIWESSQMGASRETIGKMAFNVILEMAIGIVPVLGDLVDVAWKANVRNVELLEAHLERLPTESAENSTLLSQNRGNSREGREDNRGIALVAIGAIAVTMVLAAIGTLAIIRFIWMLLTGS